jgi:hypothetical protein
MARQYILNTITFVHEDITSSAAVEEHTHMSTMMSISTIWRVTHINKRLPHRPTQESDCCLITRRYIAELTALVDVARVSAIINKQQLHNSACTSNHKQVPPKQLTCNLPGTQMGSGQPCHTLTA